MKIFKILFLAIAAIVTSFVAAPTVSAQGISADQLPLIVPVMQSNLPTEVSEGVQWTKVEVTPDATLLSLTFSFDPAPMGVSLDEFKEGMKVMGDKQVQESFGELIEMFQNLCDIDIILEFPDKTSMKYHFSKK